MSYGTYNQYDSRWGGKNYNGSSTMAAAGCGPTSCANILHNIDPSITPITTMKYMQTHGDKEHKTFAIYGNGTAWNGITQCLKYYGAQDVQRPTKMSDVWSFLSKDYAAIFLMIYRKGLPGPTWTTGGHYIAIVDYKVKNSKHYVRVEDCGGRGHDGWYCYETQMRGWISKVWTCLAQPKEIKPIVKPTDKYNGIVPEPTLKKDSKGDDVKNLQRFLTWYGIKCSIDGSFGEKTKEAVQVFQKTEGLATDGTYGKKSAAAAKAYQKNTSAPVPTPTPDSDLPKKCIDVSYWQGKISVENWKKIKKTCGYAICRTSYTSQSKFALSKDSTFATNFKNAQAAGLKVGAYHYSQAITVAEAKKEAEYMCEILKNYSPNFYVVCDFEYGGRLNSKIGSKASNIANAFCDVVKAYGYEPCIYANTSTLNSNLTNPRYPIWVAQYNDKCTYKGNKVMWQYTSKGRVDGIEAKNTNSGSANVDLSHVYIVPKENVPSPSPVVTQTTYKGDFPNLVTHSGQKLAYVAKELAWPKGTKKATYAYGTGDATNAFKKALNKGGLFVFDFYTKFKLENWNETLYEQGLDMDYVKLIQPKFGKSVINEMYYVKKGKDAYEKTGNIQVESYFDNDEILNLLKKKVADVKRSSTRKVEKRTKLSYGEDPNKIWNKGLSRNEKDHYYINPNSTFVLNFLNQFEDKDRSKILRFIEVISSSLPFDDIYNSVCNKKNETQLSEEQLDTLVMVGVSMFEQIRQIRQCTNEKAFEILCQTEPFNSEVVSAKVWERVNHD